MDVQGRASPSTPAPLAAVVAILAVLSGACASSKPAGPPRPSTPASMGRPVADPPLVEAALPSALEPSAVPESPGSPGSNETPELPETVRAVVDTALSLRGIPYRSGGTTRSGFDCSGFTMYVFRQHGITLPRSTADQFHEGKAIKQSEIKAGDLLFFKTGGREVTHVAISIDGEQFVHAPSSTGVVRVESLETTYWRSRFLGARRVD